MSYFYTNEVVFRGHPDKVADQISDGVLDAYLQQDPDSRCGIETVGGKGKIFITGEVTSKGKVDVNKVTKAALRDVGYSDDYEIINNIGQQSPDIAQGVDTGGAGDQGLMFGYACRDTEDYIPKAMAILQELSAYYNFLRVEDPRFLPDGKAQITGFYTDGGKLDYIKDFVVSYQNTERERKETDRIIKDACRHIAFRYGVAVRNFYINPTGKFLIGGFDGDAGLTGRKLLVDGYHSFAKVGGGAFSGKDPTKVDRSGAYKARQLAIRWLKNNGGADWCEVQLSYAIGMAQPLAVYVRTNGVGSMPLDGDARLDMTKHYAEECTPANIIKEFDLKNPDKIMYERTARYGHFGHAGFPWEVR